MVTVSAQPGGGPSTRLKGPALSSWKGDWLLRTQATVLPGQETEGSPHRRSSKLVVGDRGGGEDLTLTLRHAPSSFWGFPNAAFLQLLTWGTDYNDTFVPSKTRGRKVSG